MIHRSRYILILLLSGLSICAFGEQPKKSILSTMRTSFMLNAGVSNYKQPALGFTIARSGAFGYYANFMIGMNSMHMGYSYLADDDNRLLDGEYKGQIPFYTGKRAYNRLSATAGAMVRMKIPLYLYVGAGYGYKTETRELLNKQWVQAATSLGHSAVVEGGLFARWDNVTRLAGDSLFIGQQNQFYHEAKVRLGYTFKKENYAQTIILYRSRFAS